MIQMTARTGTGMNRPASIAACGIHHANKLVPGLRSQSRELWTALAMRDYLYCITNYAVIPGRRQVGFTDLPTSPEAITPAGSCSLAVATGRPVVMDSGLRSHSDGAKRRSEHSRRRNDGLE